MQSNRTYTVSCVSQSTLHRFRDVRFFTLQQHRLREIELNKKLKWDLPSWKGFQYDNLDVLPATYFIVRDDQPEGELGDVVGVARVVPTTCPSGYMLKKSFEHAVKNEELPVNDACWEGSVAVTNDRLPKEVRSRIFQLFAPAYLEFLLAQKAEWMYGLAIKKIWDRWTQSGWPVTHLGPTVPFPDGTEGTAGKLPVAESWLRRTREHAGLHPDKPILTYGSDNQIVFQLG